MKEVVWLGAGLVAGVLGKSMLQDSQRIEKKITVNVPVRTAYNQWTQFEEFPQFMQGVKSVEQLSDERLHWVAEAGGKRKDWSARITRQVPDEVLSWASEGGATNNGTVISARWRAIAPR
jgi:uncharacterized membrane protein